VVASLLSRIGVVVPVHNEEVLVGRCLSGIAEAVARSPLPVSVTVVLDRCTDQTERIANEFGGIELEIVHSRRPGVGAARSAGVQALLESNGPGQLWLATTDADSVVPPHWLVAQLAHAHDGADVVVGTVAVDDWSEQLPAVQTHYLAGYRAITGHRHMHGANLSFRASSYLAAGGFDSREYDEDVELIRRFEQADQCLIWAADLPVTTSARRVGRAPHGFADHLISLEEAP